MSNICKVKCGDKEKSIKIQRPSWCCMEQGYNIIHQIAEKAKEQAKRDERDAIGTSKLIAEYVFEYIGGALNEARIEAENKALQGENVNTYRNTCATKVSFAFNNSEIKIDDKDLKLTSGTKLIGKDNYKYYTGVSSIKGLLLENWKQLKPYSQANGRDFYKIFYDYRKEPFKTLADIYGNIFNPTRVAEIRRNNKNFFNALCSLKIKGIVTMVIEGWGNAGGHTTLWNGKGFLDETNYLDYYKEAIFVRELCFWELL